jgi:alpha-D-ribose 1-methylphosphonate 5-phosphate C-P lyase
MSVSLVEDGTHARLNFLPASGLEGAIDLTLDQLTTLMNALGVARARLLANVPAPPLESAEIKAIVDPRWRVQPEALTEGSMLAFQHPAFGPVGFVLPAPEVEKLVRALSAHLGMIRSEPSRPTKPS